MLKLNAGFNRKIGEPNYGSRGASVNVELELESSLIDDPQALMGRVRNLFDLARRAVDDELETGPPQAGNTVADNQSSQRSGNRLSGNTAGNGCICLRYLLTIMDFLLRFVLIYPAYRSFGQPAGIPV